MVKTFLKIRQEFLLAFDKLSKPPKDFENFIKKLKFIKFLNERLDRLEEQVKRNDEI